MGPVVLLAVAVLLLATGCGAGTRRAPDDWGVSGAVPTVVRNSQGTVSKVYLVGGPVRPGTYVASLGCTAVAAATAGFDVMAADPDPAAYRRGSVRVGGVERIVVRRGEYLDVAGRCSWQRVQGSGQIPPDPATLAGGCEILVGGDHLADRALAFGRLPKADRAQSVGRALQERLTAVVFTRNPRLMDPAGQLVDFLDDPDAYVQGGRLSARITGSVARIHELCGKR